MYHSQAHQVADVGDRSTMRGSMSTFRTALTVVPLTDVLVAGGMSAVPPAAAAAEEPAITVVDATRAHPVATSDTIRQAIAEAQAAGAVQEEKVNADGSAVVLIRGERGVTLELSNVKSSSRLGTGSDSYGGMYVAFNAFDQNLIISGAMTAIAAGMCALGPAVCVVANVAAVLASTAIGNGGGVRCGTKSLRVYPTSNRAPRCA
jgi:hypothetical protein